MRLLYIVAKLVQGGHEDLADKLLVEATRKIKETEWGLVKIPDRWRNNAPKSLLFQGDTYTYRPNEVSKLMGGGGVVVRYRGPEVEQGLRTHLSFTIVPTEMDKVYKIRVMFVDPKHTHDDR
jgi:hypothetical protein